MDEKVHLDLMNSATCSVVRVAIGVSMVVAMSGRLKGFSSYGAASLGGSIDVKLPG